MERVSIFDRVFATTIAFVLPGLAVLVGAATVTPTVATWFGAASSSPTLVGFLFVLLAAVALGMVVTSVRWWIFECAHLGRFRLVQDGDTPINEQARKDHAAEYEDLRFAHYFYYLATANMAVAIPLALVIWNVGTRPDAHVAAIVWIIAVPLALVLGAAGRESLAVYIRKRLRLVGPFAAATA